MSDNNENWSTVIKPREKLLQLNLREVWDYRDLCSLFVRRNITTQYKQTVLGPLWYVIQPMITVVMYMVVFGGIAKIPTDGLPQPLFYLGGICMWQYFNDCLTKTLLGLLVIIIKKGSASSGKSRLISHLSFIKSLEFIVLLIVHFYHLIWKYT